MSFTQNNGTLQAGTIAAFYTGTDNLLAGYGVCYDYSQTTVADRSRMVVKPSYLNTVTNPGFAGVVARDVVYDATKLQSLNGVQGVWIDIVPLVGQYPLRPLLLYTDVNVTQGDMLGVRPGSYIFGKAVSSAPIARAMETVDRSATNGTVNVEYGRYRWDDYPLKLRRWFDHFTNPVIPGVVAGALASHNYFLKGTTAVAALATAGSTPAGTGIGELNLTGTTTTEAQIQQIGAQYLLNAGRELFCRMRVKIDDISDEDWFWGLGTPPTESAGVLTGVSQIASAGTTPNGTDYIGFYVDATGFSGVPKINIRKASGTENATTGGVALVNDTYIELAFLARNRLAGTTAGYKTVYAFINGSLVASLESATQAAAFPDTVPLAWAMAGITGGCLGTIDLLEINYHQ